MIIFFHNSIIPPVTAPPYQSLSLELLVVEWTIENVSRKNWLEEITRELTVRKIPSHQAQDWASQHPQSKHKWLQTSETNEPHGYRFLFPDQSSQAQHTKPKPQWSEIQPAHIK